ncbi:sulfotransferase [Pelagibacterales bacterium SAG-MED19]|nr:sulfotransferase [Pelagibacterales bacterium SAG-MED19]
MDNTKNLILEAKELYSKKSYFEAKSCLLKVFENFNLDIKLKMNLYVLISDIYYKINEFENAENYLLKYLKEDRSNSNIFNLLGNVYLKKRDFKNSEKSYLESEKLDKNNETAIFNLAILYHNLGKKKEAISFYKKILIKNPKKIGILFNLASLDKTIINEEKISFLKKIINDNKLNHFDMASCYFLIAENEKKKKNFKDEINLLSSANKLSFRSNEKKNIQLNEYWLKIIPKKFNKIEFKKKYANTDNTKNFYPIFIIGLPRCGSTLIESIISSGKDKVENLGETNLVNWAFLNTNRDFLKLIDNKKKIIIDYNLTAKKLIGSIDNLIINKNNDIYFSEKSLENFYYIELILNIYPNAKFINPYRNIIDNTFAIYKQFLSNISWSHSLENILLYFDNYFSTINYFKQKYSDKIFSISLEEFSNDPKNSAMEIYKFCNLRWDEKCLDFYKRDDLFTNTASINQIRSAVQKYDLSKYEAYKGMLNKYLKKYSWLNNN